MKTLTMQEFTLDELVSQKKLEKKYNSFFGNIKQKIADGKEKEASKKIASFQHVTNNRHVAKMFR
jgi:hypothetical protein